LLIPLFFPADNDLGNNTRQRADGDVAFRRDAGGPSGYDGRCDLAQFSRWPIPPERFAQRPGFRRKANKTEFN